MGDARVGDGEPFGEHEVGIGSRSGHGDASAVGGMARELLGDSADGKGDAGLLSQGFGITGANPTAPLGRFWESEDEESDSDEEFRKSSTPIRLGEFVKQVGRNNRAKSFAPGGRGSRFPMMAVTTCSAPLGRPKELSSILVPIPPMELMESPRKSLQIKRELVQADCMQRMSSVQNLRDQSSTGAGLAAPATDNLDEFPLLNPISRASLVKLVRPLDFLTEVVVNEVQTMDVVEREVSIRDSPKCGSSGVMAGSIVCPIRMVSVPANQLLAETQERKTFPGRR
jgi:hypothetical protein